MKILTHCPREFKQNKEWYHQRFDGSPLFISTIAEAELKKEKRTCVGTEPRVRVCIFKDHRADWYLDMDDVRRGSQTIIMLAKKDARISTKLLRAWKYDEKLFQHMFDNFDKVDVKRLSDTQLLSTYRTYYARSMKRFSSTAIIDHFALGTDEYIARMMRAEVGTLKNESEFTKIFSIATAPVHQSFINKSEMELLKIVIEAPYDEKRIAAYQKKYFFIKNNYFDARVLGVAHFKKEIAIWQNSGADLHGMYRQLRKQPILNAQRKRKFFRKYKFSRLLLTLLKISEDFTWWQDERKRATYQNIHMGMKLLGEMARRRGIESEAVKYLVLSEVEKWFTKDLPSKIELKNRMRECAFVVSREGYYIISGQKNVSKVRAILFGKQTSDDVNDIRGLSASVGCVTGTVKVVGSVQEIGKVEQGDILVAVMTRPDYIAGIKKATALVTNEGGITCHAAIVARELGIPCIIGTKIATEVLKDGDMVEVNANHGVVTVLKRAIVP